MIEHIRVQGSIESDVKKYEENLAALSEGFVENEELAAEVSEQLLTQSETSYRNRMTRELTSLPVSYTHLDVYKRQDGLILPMYESDGIGEKLEEIVPRDQCVLLETDITPEEYYQTVGPDNRKLGGVLAGQIRACLLYTSRCV